MLTELSYTEIERVSELLGYFLFFSLLIPALIFFFPCVLAVLLSGVLSRFSTCVRVLLPLSDVLQKILQLVC